jgi:hypothetical protein
MNKKTNQNCTFLGEFAVKLTISLNKRRANCMKDNQESRQFAMHLQGKVHFLNNLSICFTPKCEFVNTIK